MPIVFTSGMVYLAVKPFYILIKLSLLPYNQGHPSSNRMMFFDSAAFYNKSKRLQGKASIPNQLL